VKSFDRTLAADAAARRGVEVSLKMPEVNINAFLQIDSDSIRIQGGGAVDNARSFSDLQAAMPDLFDLIWLLNDSFSEKKSGGKLAIIPRRAHRDRDRAMSAARNAKPNFKRFFNRENVGRVFGRRPGDDTSNGNLRKCWSGFHI